jgi:hypothetical protein
MANVTLDHFGEFIVHNVRDKALEQFALLQKGCLRSPAMLDIQAQFTQLPDDQRILVNRIVVDLVDTLLHDLLFALQDAEDRDLGVKILVDHENVAKLSGMLHGEIQGPTGWIARFSRFAVGDL